MRLTAIVSGKVQQVGYRARVIDIANGFGIKGMIENLLDGRVKIIAEGDAEKLKWFESAIDIKNTLIDVSSIEKEYSPARNEFDNFGKLVAKGETDARLDTAVGYLKEIASGINKMNDNLGSKMDKMLDKQDQMIEKQDQMIEKQDQMIEKQDTVIGKQDELLYEVKDINRKFDKVLENDIIQLKDDMAEVKAALRAKGII